MAEPFLGEIRIAAFPTPPRGWALCNGQLLAINTNQALFSLLGTMYGGNGVSTFALPDLRGRAPLHVDGTHPQGLPGGEATHTLNSAELPSHSHALMAVSDLASSPQPNGAMPAAKGRGGVNIYTPGGTPTVDLSPQSLSPTGGSQPHDNMQPYLTVNFMIATQGIFPSRS